MSYLMGHRVRYHSRDAHDGLRCWLIARIQLVQCQLRDNIEYTWCLFCIQYLWFKRYIESQPLPHVVQCKAKQELGHHVRCAHNVCACAVCTLHQCLLFCTKNEHFVEFLIQLHTTCPWQHSDWRHNTNYSHEHFIKQRKKNVQFSFYWQSKIIEFQEEAKMWPKQWNANKTALQLVVQHTQWWIYNVMYEWGAVILKDLSSAMQRCMADAVEL